MDTILSRYTNLLAMFQEEQASYAIKPTKASSARLRNISTQIHSISVDLRKELVAADKAQ